MRGLAVLIGWIAVVCALMTAASKPYVILVFTTTVFVFTVAAIAAIYDRGVNRAFSVGFVLVGVVYLSSVYFCDSHQLLLTSNLLRFARPEKPWDLIAWNGNRYSAFETMGELILTLLFSYFGGLWASYLHSRRVRDRPE